MLVTSIGILLTTFVINIIPAFMPPTWILISFVGFNFHLNILTLVILCLFAACAATSGRIVLTLLSDKIIRHRILNERTIENINILKNNIEKRKAFTFGFFLFYAFSPLPSGQLFLAYGLTELRLRLAAIPFFIGRLISYLFWAFTASAISKTINLTTLESSFYFSAYFILAQIVALYLVYVFIKIDWKILFEEHKIQFIKKMVD